MTPKRTKRKTHLNHMDKRKQPLEPETLMMTADDAHELLTGGQKRLISRAAFYVALAKNEIPNVRLGRRFLIPRAAFMHWLQHGQQAQHAQNALR